MSPAHSHAAIVVHFHFGLVLAYPPSPSHLYPHRNGLEKRGRHNETASPLRLQYRTPMAPRSAYAAQAHQPITPRIGGEEFKPKNGMGPKSPRWPSPPQALETGAGPTQTEPTQSQQPALSPSFAHGGHRKLQSRAAAADVRAACLRTAPISTYLVCALLRANPKPALPPPIVICHTRIHSRRHVSTRARNHLLIAQHQPSRPIDLVPVSPSEAMSGSS
ncbi:hypothetical protein ACJZ2D_003267 [Fusarium nematophilum]